MTERIHKLEDAGAIRGYTVLVDPTVFGLGIAAPLGTSSAKNTSCIHLNVYIDKSDPHEAGKRRKLMTIYDVTTYGDSYPSCLSQDKREACNWLVNSEYLPKLKAPRHIV